MLNINQCVTAGDEHLAPDAEMQTRFSHQIYKTVTEMDVETT